MQHEINHSTGKAPCLVLLSGGIDSSTALYFMKAEGYDVQGLFIDYQHKSRQEEIRGAAYMANELDCLLHIVGVPLDQQFFIDAKPLKPPGKENCNNLQDEGLDVLLCLSHWLFVASIYCLHLAIPKIVIGVTASDSHRFPWVGWDFLDHISRAVSSWAGKGPKVFLPFLLKEKEEVVRIAAKLGVPLNRTWSCLEQGKIHCGICDGCKIRRSAFIDSEINDDMRYEVDL